LKVIQIVEHLQTESFYIVAAGNVNNITTIFAYSIGHITNNYTAIQFLVELKLIMTMSYDTVASGNTNSDSLWLLQCKYKCTDSNLSSAFLKNMKLADVMQLASSD
jgi:hypothetical protein